MSEIRLGDRITFKAVCRWPTRTVTRKVTGFHKGWPTVHYGGWQNFVVRPSEVSKVYGPRWGSGNF